MKFVKAPMLNTPLPAIDDTEMDSIPMPMPCVIDAHVHLFPDEIFNAVWKKTAKSFWSMLLNLG